MARRGRAGAAGSGATVVDGVRRRLAAGEWKSGLTVLTGEDLFHLDQAQRLLLAGLVPDEASEFALTVFGEQRVKVAAVVAAVRSVGMFADRRVVLVRDVAALDGEPDPLLEFAKQPPASSFLLVRAPKLDRRRKLHQKLATAGVLLDFPSAAGADPFDLVRAVAALAKGKQLELESEAAAFLAEACVGDFYRIDSELEKVNAWIGTAGRRRVDLDTIREVAAVAGLVSGWEVADAVLQRDRGAALTALRALLEAGEEPLKLLGGLAFRARGMLRAKALVARGVPPARAFPAARLFGQRHDSIARGLGRYSLEDLRRFPGMLLQADVTLKSRSVAPGAVLEALVEALTADRSGADRGRAVSS